MKQLDLIIRNRTGLHARPARVFVDIAKQFQSTIRIGHGQKLVNAKSLISVLTLGVASGQQISIDVDGTEYASLVREKQRDYIKNRLLHVDFLAVSLNEKLRATVTIHFIGVSLAVKDFGAVMVHNLEELEVEALPGDLPERIDVDISVLSRIGDGIRVRDVVVPDNIRLLDNPDTMVAVATAPKVEEEEVEVAGAEVVAATEGEPELSVERGKKEDEEEQ